MKKKKILICCEPDPTNNPRPNRMISFLKDDFQIFVVSRFSKSIDGVEKHFDLEAISELPKRNVSYFGFLEKMKNLVKKIIEFFQTSRVPLFLLKIIKNVTEKIASTSLVISSRETLLKNRFSKFKEELQKHSFDLVISHDLTLLPAIFSLIRSLKKEPKVLFDAREYYPREAEDRKDWNTLQKSFILNLVEKYMTKCDKILTVSQGLAEEYKEEFGLECEVFKSLPIYHNLEPSSVNSRKVKIIHHGRVAKDRKIENMIYLGELLESRFSLDLMLTTNDKESENYLEYLKSLSKKYYPKTQIIEPVKFEEIIPFTNKYDIGLYLASQSNFNIEKMLPNKFFEFVQARLMIAIGPSSEMIREVKKYNLGIFSQNFEIESLAKSINKLTQKDIEGYKENSNKIAKSLSTLSNKSLLKSIVLDLLT